MAEEKAEEVGESMKITADDYEKLKKDVKAEVLQEITSRDLRTDNKMSGPLAEVRNKYRQLLFDTYGVYHYAQVWDHIRRLSCYFVGVRYVKQLLPSNEVRAAEYAETLCKMAIERGR